MRNAQGCAGIVLGNVRADGALYEASA